MDFFDQNSWDENPQINLDQDNLTLYNASRTDPIEIHSENHTIHHGDHSGSHPGNHQGSHLMHRTQPLDNPADPIISIDTGSYHTSYDSFNVRDQAPHPAVNDSTQDSINEQFFSPALSFQGTPLMSPHALAPQPISAQYHSRYRTHSTGKITKPSPSQWRSGSATELDDLGDFDLGDPAMSVYDPLPQHSATTQEDIDDKLEAAITATTNVNSNRSSLSCPETSRRPSNASSRHGSRSNTPRIRPKVSLGSTDLSPKPLDINDSFSRSNYQSLVDGNHQHLGLPGAERMVTNLKAKKTVHKIAEKERRNRMNQAIIELSAVMGPVNDPNSITTSKAATVERATTYIQHLQSRIAELEKRNGAKSNLEKN